MRRGRKTWNECVKVDIRPGLLKDVAQNRDRWKSLTTGNSPQHCLRAVMRL